MKRPAGAERLAGDTWYVPALTNSGFVEGLCIDTGPECEAYAAATVDTLVVTHGHADHFSVAAELRRSGTRVLASRDDARLIENPEVNIRGMFSWARPGDLMVTKLFKGEPCVVDGLLENLEDPRARAIPTSGHTLGHHAVLTKDGVLFSGDALYQKALWDRHPLPYAIDPQLVANSLRAIDALDFDVLVPGHGEPCSHEEASAHIAHHIERITEIEHFILDELIREHTTEEAIAAVSRKVGLSDNPAGYWLAVTTVKGYLGDMLGRGDLEFFVRDHSGWWRRTPAT